MVDETTEHGCRWTSTDDGPGLDPTSWAGVRAVLPATARAGWRKRPRTAIVQAVVESHGGRSAARACWVRSNVSFCRIRSRAWIRPREVTVPRLAQVRKFRSVRSGSLWAMTASAFPGPPSAGSGRSGAALGPRGVSRWWLPARAAGGARGGRVLVRRYVACEHRVRRRPSTAVSPPVPPVSGNGNARFGASFQALQDCLKKNGVTLPSFARPTDERPASGQPPRVRAARSGAGSAVASAPRAPAPGVSAMRGPRRRRPVPRCDRHSLPVRAGRAEPVASTQPRWRRDSCLKDHARNRHRKLAPEARRSLDRSGPTESSGILTTCAPLTLICSAGLLSLSASSTA